MTRRKFVVNTLTNNNAGPSNNPVFSYLKLFLRRLIKTKSIIQLQEEANNDNEFKRSLGSFQLLMLGIGSIIGKWISKLEMVRPKTDVLGTGIFVLSGQTAANFAGPAVILSFLLAAIVAGLAAFSYAEMASMVPISGSAYSYTYASK